MCREERVKFTMPCRLIHGKSFPCCFHTLKKTELSPACSLKHLAGKGKMEAEPKQHPCKVLNSKAKNQRTPDSPEHLSQLHPGFLGPWLRQQLVLPSHSIPISIPTCSLRGLAGYFHWVWLTTGEQRSQLPSQEIR